MKKVVILKRCGRPFSSAPAPRPAEQPQIDRRFAGYAMGLDMGSYIQNMDTMLDANLNLAVIAKAMQDVAKRYFRDEQGRLWPPNGG